MRALEAAEQSAAEGHGCSGLFLQEAGDNNQFCWRNLFSCINLLRILNKLTKWKHSRTMVSQHSRQAWNRELQAECHALSHPLHAGAGVPRVGSLLDSILPS